MKIRKFLHTVHKFRSTKLISGILALAMFFIFLIVSENISFKALDIDGTSYTVYTEEDFKSAVTDIKNKGAGEYTITLGADMTINDGPIELDCVGSTITIHGENHTILSVAKSCIGIKNRTILNLGGANYNKTLSIVDLPPQSDNSSGTLLYAAGNATLNMYSGVTLFGRYGADSTGGVSVERSSVFNMYGGKISDCRSDTAAGGVLALGNSKFNMSGGTIKNCETGGRGVGGGAGVAAIDGSEFKMTGGTIEGCSCVSGTPQYGGLGGGVFVNGSSTCEIDGGKIEGCHASRSGGGVYVSNSQFKMKAGTIQDCDSVNYGGGVYTNSKFEMSGGTISGCTNSGYGGGGVCIYTPRGTDTVGFEMSGGKIVDCVANSNINYGLGGGVLVINGLADVKGESEIYNNHASMAGDDIFSFGTNGKLKLTDVPEGLVLSETNHEIDGWYVDGVVDGEDTDRWDKDNFAQKYVPSPEQVIVTQIALKAAHGPISYNYYNYTLKYYLDGELDETLTQTGKSDTVHLDDISAPDNYKIDSVEYINVVEPTAEAPGSFEVHVYCSKEVKPVTELRCQTKLNGEVLNVIVQDPNHVIPNDVYLKVTPVPKNTTRWNKLYSSLGDEKCINNLAFFDVELLYKSNNKPVTPMPLGDDVKVFFQIPSGWNKDNLKTVFVMLGAENVGFEGNIVSMDGADYLVFWTRNFGPYALMDKMCNKERSPSEQQNLNKQNSIWQLPSTGDSGLGLYVISGIFLASLAALCIMHAGRKSKID